MCMLYCLLIYPFLSVIYGVHVRSILNVNLYITFVNAIQYGLCYCLLAHAFGILCPALLLSKNLFLYFIGDNTIDTIKNSNCLTVILFNYPA